MRIFKKIWDEFIYGGHLLAIGLACMVTMAAILLNIKITWDFIAIIYLLTLGPCLFGRYVDLKKDSLTNPERSQYLSKKARIIPPLIAFCAIVLIFIFLYFGKYLALLFGIFLILLSFLYDLFFKNLTKKIIGFKNFFVGTLFSLLVVMLILYYHAPITISFWLVMIFLYLMTAMGASFSDIKDIESDKEEGLKTFAVVLGHHKLIKALIFIIVLAELPIITGFYFGLLPKYSLMLLLIIPYNLLLFKKSFDKDINIDFLYSVAFDSQLVWWLVFVLLGELLIK